MTESRGAKSTKRHHQNANTSSALPAKVAELEHSRLWIQQEVLGFDVPVADSKGMDVGQAPEQLVHVQLHTGTREVTAAGPANVRPPQDTHPGINLGRVILST